MELVALATAGFLIIQAAAFLLQVSKKVAFVSFMCVAVPAVIVLRLIQGVK